MDSVSQLGRSLCCWQTIGRQLEIGITMRDHNVFAREKGACVVAWLSCLEKRKDG